MLTECANKVVMDAQKEAKFVGHKYISTEHILLGILGDANGLAAKILKSFGIDLNVSREEVKKLIGRGGGCSGLVCKDVRFTYDAKNVLDFSFKQAKFQGISCSKGALCIFLHLLYCTTYLYDWFSN